MSSIIDMISSLVFSGALFVIVLNANDIAIENQAVYHGDMVVQEMLTSTAQLVEGEFRNMGFGVPEKQATVLFADSTRIAFLSDLDRSTSTTIDTIRYQLGSTSELAGTQNDLDRYLNRSVNGETPIHVGTVTQFLLKYYTRSGEMLPLPVPSDRLAEIHIVEVTMEVQNPYALARRPGDVVEGERAALYSSALWQQTRLASQNSRR